MLTEQIPKTQQNNKINGFHSLLVIYLFPTCNFKGTDVMIFTTTSAEIDNVKCTADTC